MRLKKVKTVVLNDQGLFARNFAVRSLPGIASFLLFFFTGIIKGNAQAPVPDFTANITSGCSPMVVQFTDKSTGNPTFWNWDLGNGQLSTLQNPVAGYSTPGTYTITLVVRNANGIDAITKTNYIVVNPSPTSSFVADKTISCLPATIQFTDQSIPNAGSINQWFWDFGDGTTSTQQNPSKTYNTIGFYTVLLKVTSTTGCVGQSANYNYIRVVSGVTADFTFTNPVTCSAPFTVNLSNQTSGPGSLSYNWDFGNATNSNNTNPIATYTAPGTYNISLTATSQYGCSGAKQKSITIPSITTAINSPDSVCLDEIVNFQNSSFPAPANTVWDFGNGRGSIKLNDTSSFSTSGSYTIKLVSTYPTCKDSVTKQVYARPKPTVTFTAPAVTSCKAPFTVSFQDTSPDAVNWLWDFGDGSTSNTKNPSHTYNTTGSFDVTLTITDSKGCTNLIKSTSFVRIVPPTVSISNAPAGGCVPFTYSPSATVNSIDGIASYLWDFGDGNTSTSPTPTNIYNAFGTYTLKLTITTNGGCTQTIQFPGGIKVGTPLATNFNFTQTTPCASSSIQFNDLTPGADSWLWSFGDGGNSTLKNPLYKYKDTGSFAVTLIAFNNGCGKSFTSPTAIHIQPPIAAFIYQVSCSNKRQVLFTNNSKTDPSYGPVSYQWLFGDALNSTSTAVNPVFNYTTQGNFNVKLISTNGACTDTSLQTLSLNIDIADFTVSKSNICRNEIFQVNSQNSSPANVTSYEWSFDGGPFTNLGPSFQHQFATTGPHSITLVITDINGCKDTLVKTAAVIVSGPTALFTVPMIGACKNAPVTFNDISLFTAPITQWKWDFGDGIVQNFTSGPFVHQYSDTGQYQVMLTLTDNFGCKDSVIRRVPVIITRPLGGFTSNFTSICPGVPVQFTDTTKGYGLTYNWDFGDGNTGTGPAPTHTYTGTDNSYSVKLFVTDTVGCKDTLTKVNYIAVRTPKPSFLIKDTTSICPPLETKFTFLGKDYESYYWDFGDGGQSTLPNPNHFYNNFGNFTAKLIMTGYGGCMDSTSANVHVFDPVANSSLTYSPIQGCNSILVDFNITTPPGTKLYFYSSDGFIDSSQQKQFKYLYKSLGLYVPTIYMKDSSGCQVGRGGSQTIKILGAEPLFGLDKKAFCDTSTVLFANFTIFNDPIVSSVWDFGDGNTSTIKDPSHFYATAGTYIPSLTVTTQAGCTKSLTDTVRVYQTPSPIITGDTVVCINETLLLQGSLKIADTLTNWKWDFGNGNSSTLRNPSTKFASNGVYTVKLEAANKLGCKNSITHRVFVPTDPVITFGPDPVIPVGSSIPLPVSYSNNIVTYNWVPSNSLNCSNCPVPVANPKSTTKYKVTATDIYGCSSSNEGTVIVVCNDKNFFVPNTFSPNNDGNNDVFYPRGTGLARVQSLRIFNRWGELVFERRNFLANDPSLGWDGTYKGQKAGQDTYVYVVEFICENSVIIPYKGNVTLIR